MDDQQPLPCGFSLDLPLEEPDLERYSRQLLLPGFTLESQLALADAVIGVDVGIPLAALYLAGAGVGALHLVGPVAELPRLRAQVHRLNSRVRLAESTETVSLWIVQSTTAPSLPKTEIQSSVPRLIAKINREQLSLTLVQGEKQRDLGCFPVRHVPAAHWIGLRAAALALQLLLSEPPSSNMN